VGFSQVSGEGADDLSLARGDPDDEIAPDVQGSTLERCH